MQMYEEKGNKGLCSTTFALFFTLTHNFYQKRFDV